jgi:hypothetical protein
MNPGSIPMLFYRKEKVLTIVGAFFVAPNKVSVLSRNHCPESARITVRIGQEYTSCVLNQKMKLEIFKGSSKNRSSENCINQAQQKVGIKIHRSVVTLLNHVITNSKSACYSA